MLKTDKTPVYRVQRKDGSFVYAVSTGSAGSNFRYWLDLNTGEEFKGYHYNQKPVGMVDTVITYGGITFSE